MKNKAIVAGLCLMVAMIATGCKDAAKKRSTEDFYVKGLRDAVGRLKRQTLKDDIFALRDAADKVGEMLQGLPRRLEKNRVPRLAEKKKVAEDALEAYYEIEGPIRGRKMAPDESDAKLDAILAMVDKIIEP